jgi:hypothetical protein
MIKLNRLKPRLLDEQEEGGPHGDANAGFELHITQANLDTNEQSTTVVVVVDSGSSSSERSMPKLVKEGIEGRRRASSSPVVSTRCSSSKCI